VGIDAEHDTWRELIVEPALHGADDVAVAVLITAVVPILVHRVAADIAIEDAALVIDVQVRPADTATGAEIETCPAADRGRLRHHVRGKGRGADRPQGECCDKSNYSA